MPQEIPLSQIVKGAVDQIARSFNEHLVGLVSALSDSAASLDQSLGTAVGDLTTPISAINTTLGQIKTILAGSLKADIHIPDTECNVYSGFDGSFTGTGSVSAYSGQIRLKGYAVAAVVGTTLAATANTGVTLSVETSGGTVIAPIGSFEDVAGKGTRIQNGGVTFVGLGSGPLFSNLVVRANQNIGAGVIYVAGAVWGSSS